MRALIASGARLAGVVAATAIATSSADGQGNRRQPAPRIQAEARADYIDARAPTAHLGVGLSVPVGTYVRLGGVVAAGQAWADGEARLAARIDALARFVVDPQRESRWAPYAAGGLGALFDDHDRWRAVLVGALGVEGPPAGGVVPAIEVGFGGGARFGIALRRAMPGRR